MKSFVEANRKISFCPNPNCENAVRFLGFGRPVDVVECTCGLRYWSVSSLVSHVYIDIFDSIIIIIITITFSCDLVFVFSFSYSKVCHTTHPSVKFHLIALFLFMLVSLSLGIIV